MLEIVIDTREQNPYEFQGYAAVTARAGLSAGDYSIPGFTDRVAVERKELSDLLGCLTHGRERFVRELERLRGYDAAAVVVEAPFFALAGGGYRSRMNPESAVQSVISLMGRYRVPFFFADGRDMGEYFAFHFLRHYARHALERYKAIAGIAGGLHG